MKAKRPAKTGLRKVVERALKEHKGRPLEHRFVIAEASDYLLQKIVPKEKQREAKRLEANSQRLLEATTLINSGLPVTTQSARKIFEILLEQVPEFRRRGKEKGVLNAINEGRLAQLEQNIGKDLQRLKDFPGKAPVMLSPDFIETAREIHLESLRQLLGEKKFRIYTKAMGKTMGVLARKSK